MTSETGIEFVLPHRFFAPLEWVVKEKFMAGMKNFSY
jgi:hypothetical protein